MLKGEYVVGGLGSLYLPSITASGERRRATCSQEFRMKGGRLLQKRERSHGGMALWTLSLYLNKVDSCRTPLSPLWTLAFHSMIFHIYLNHCNTK